MRTFSQFLSIAFFALAAPLGATTVSVSGHQLLVNCAPFLMRGMNYSPGAIGQGPGGFDWYSNAGLLAQDIASMKAVGVNTVRVYLDYGALWNNSGGDPNNDVSTNPTVVANVTAALNSFQANGIYVIINYWLPYGEALMASPNPRQWEELKFQKVIRVFKNNPAVLMWVFGNENNASFNRSVTAPQLFAFFQEAVSAAKSAEAPPQPISVVLSEASSDGAHLDHQNAAYLNAAPAVDLWGLNLYQNDGGFVTGLDGYTDSRPLFISEFGQDAWNNNTAAQDPASQSSFYQDRWANYIGTRLSALNASNKVVGACVFEWNDEWYKDTTGSWGAHDNGGFAIPNDNDNFSNEEWYGLGAALAAGSNGPRTYRTAYTTLKNLWTASPYNTVPPTSCCPLCTATRTATPTATPNPCAPASFDDFEDLNLTDAWGGTWGASQQDNASYVNVGLGSHSGGGLTYGFNTVGNWSVLYSSLSAVADPTGNSGTGVGAVDLTPYGQVSFWVKGSSAGVYSFTVASDLALSPGYAWYKASFNVSSSWTQVVLNLDGFTFTNPGGNYGSWQQNEQAATQFTLVPPAGVSGTLNLDDVRLTRWCGVPTATTTATPFGTPTATPNICLPQMIDDFESGNAVNAFGGAWNWSQQTGAASLAVGAGGQSGLGLSWTYSALAGWSVLYSALNAGADPAGNAGAGSGNRDLSAEGQVRFWVKAGSPGSYVFKVASNTIDSPAYAWYQAPFNVSTAWTQVSLNLDAATFSNPGGNSATWAQTLSRATQFVLQPVTDTATTVQIDGLQLVNWCGLPSPTITASTTATRSPSPSAPSATSTATPSRTPSSSATATASPSTTSKSSPTPSVTLSATPSLSPEASPSVSSSRTASPTFSRTATASSSPSASVSPSGSPTPVLSPTPSWTAVPPGSTFTDTPTGTATVSASPSSSMTRTQTQTATPSSTATLSATPSQSVTASSSASSSPSATPSLAWTGSPSPASSPSASQTLSASPSMTPTRSSTRTPSFSATPTTRPSLTATPDLSPQPSVSPSAQPSQAGSDGPCRVSSLMPLPNPNPLRLSVRLDGPADGLRLDLYSTAMTLLQRGELGSPLQAGWNSVALPAGFLAARSNGLYYVQALPLRKGQPGIPGTAKLLWMR